VLRGWVTMSVPSMWIDTLLPVDRLHGVDGAVGDDGDRSCCGDP
jgi:hypothetical protein